MRVSVMAGLSRFRSTFHVQFFFDTDFYLTTNPDVARSGVDPLWHYRRFGRKEGRSPSRFFDVARFMADHPGLHFRDLDLAQACLALHGSYFWVSAGSAPAQSPGPGARPTLSWWARLKRWRLWQRCRDSFDAAFYLRAYPDVARTPDEAFLHYMHRGFSEDRQPRIDFDGDAYRQDHGLSLGDNPFLHAVSRSAGAPLRGQGAGEIQLSGTADVAGPDLSLCIHVHCFYTDLIDEIILRCQRLHGPFHLVVTVCDPAAALVVRERFAASGRAWSLDVLVVENRGRDLAPFLGAARTVWCRFDIVLHLHSKKSPHISWGDGWRRYLFDQTIGSAQTLHAVLAQFHRHPDLGMLYPANYAMIRRFMRDPSPEGQLQRVAARLGLTLPDDPILGFAAGSMAFYRVKALDGPLADPDLLDLFEAEQGALEGTAAHALERLIPEYLRQRGHGVQAYLRPW